MKSHVFTTRRHGAFTFAFSLAVVATLAAMVAQAADSYWVGSDGNFTNSTKWTPAVPGAADNAYFTNSSDNVNITWLSDAANANAFFAQPSKTLYLFVSNSTWSVTNSFMVSAAAGSTNTLYFRSGSIVVTNEARTAQAVLGSVNRGGLILQGGNLVADHFYATNNGTFPLHLNMSYGSLVTYANSKLVFPGATYLGTSTAGSMLLGVFGGTNELVVQGGNNLVLGKDAGNVGAIAVSGSGTVLSNASLSLVLGESGRGFLSVTNGGRFFNAGNLQFSTFAAASNSSVLVAGAGSVVTNAAHLYTGYAASGSQITVSNGGRMSVAGRFYHGNTANTSNHLLLVEGNESLFELTAANEFYVGVNGTADIVVTNGGQVLARGYYVYVGNGAAGNGRILVSGTNSVFGAVSPSLGTIYVGSNATTRGRGSIVVNDGGAVEFKGSLVSGFNGSGTISNTGGIYEFASSSASIVTNTPGSITLESGTISWKGVASADINNAQVAKIARSGDNTFRLNTSTNALLASYTFQTNNGLNYAFLDVRNGGRFQATSLLIGSGGRVGGDGIVASVNVTNQGTIAPGNSPGTLTFTSNLTLLSDSVLSMEIGGTNSGAFDRLVVGGTLTKTGAVEVSLLSYNPSEGDTFDLLDWGAMLGSFGSLNLPSLSGGLQWDSTQFESQGILMVVNAIPEPSVLVLAALGAGLAFALRRRSS